MLGVNQTCMGSCSLIFVLLCVCVCACVLQGPARDFPSTKYLFGGLLMDGPVPLKISALSTATIKTQTKSSKVYAEQYGDDIKIVWCFALGWNNVASGHTVLWRRLRDQQQSFREFSHSQISKRGFYRYNFKLC